MSCLRALDNFFASYLNAYSQSIGELPRYYAQGEASECIVGASENDADNAVYWQPVLRKQYGKFDNVAEALSLSLHSDLADFYGRYYAGPLIFDSAWGEGELLQVWNEDDFTLLQQNMIGHLMMKQKLKQPLTWFIGILDNGDVMITVDNDTGAVATEIPGEPQREILAASVADFIEQLQVKVAPPQRPIEGDADGAIADHPGIINSIKRMWHNLIGK